MSSSDSSAVFLRRPQVEAMTGLARSTIYQWVAEGRFPKPVHLSGKAVAWVKAEIDEWNAARIADRAA